MNSKQPTSFYAPRTAAAVIIANMIGTGVFTSLGFQLLDIQTGFPLLMLWVLGGIAALCGAASYAELGAALPRSGGEYNFLGRVYHPVTDMNFAPQTSDWSTMTSGAFAVALIYVSYGYAGWNAATYISGEMEHPQRDLPRVLLIGTSIVMALYVALNFIFLRVAPVEAMLGKEEVGYIAAGYIFGESGARAVGFMLSLLLVSTVSAMVLAGPRALQAVGEDFRALSFLGKTNADGVPRNAIYFQSAITLAFIITSSFEFIVVFAGAVLALNSLLAVLGVFILRVKEPDLARPYKTWGYPLTPLIYIALTAFTLVFVIKTNPTKALFALVIISVGGLFYWISEKANM